MEPSFCLVTKNTAGSIRTSADKIKNLGDPGLWGQVIHYDQIPARANKLSSTSTNIASTRHIPFEYVLSPNYLAPNTLERT